MLTQCPRCDTIYRIAAADLGSARGFVECGECGEQFDALVRLADEPKFAGQTVPESGVTEPQWRTGNEPENTAGIPQEAVDRAPGFAAPAGTDPALPVHTVVEQSAPLDSGPPDTGAATPPPLPQHAASPAFESWFEIADEAPAAITLDTLARDSALSARKSVEEDPVFLAPALAATAMLSESEHAILFTEPGDDPERLPEEELAPIDLDDVPAVIKSEFVALMQGRPRPFRWQWRLLAAALLFSLALQIAWVFRDEVRVAVPETVTVYSEICARIGCRPDRPRPSAIELVARDVRDHPQYRDSLLVNATLINRSLTAVPFPAIQLGLRGATGEVIGIRRFDPREYLDKSIDIDSGMPPSRPVYIVMEVAEAGTLAVSFEFVFL